MLKEKYGYGKPIFVEDLSASEAKVIEGSQDIKVFTSGIYYFPKTTTLGGVVHELPIEVSEVIERRYVTNGDDVYGYISGHTLRNLAGLTRQVPSFIEISTNNATELERNAFIGSKKVKTHKAPLTVTKDNAHKLQFLDLMTLIEPDHLDETSMWLFREWLKENPITYTELLPYIDVFPENVKTNLENKVIKDEIT